MAMNSIVHETTTAIICDTLTLRPTVARIATCLHSSRYLHFVSRYQFPVRTFAVQGVASRSNMSRCFAMAVSSADVYMPHDQNQGLIFVVVYLVHFFECGAMSPDLEMATLNARTAVHGKTWQFCGRRLRKITMRALQSRGSETEQFRIHLRLRLFLLGSLGREG